MNSFGLNLTLTQILLPFSLRFILWNLHESMSLCLNFHLKIQKLGVLLEFAHNFKRLSFDRNILDTLAFGRNGGTRARMHNCHRIFCRCRTRTR